GQQDHFAVRVQVFRTARHGGHAGRGRRVGVYHDEQVQLVHRALHFQTARLGVGRVAPVEDGADLRGLINVAAVFKDAVNPARHGDAVLAHQAGRGVARLDPLIVHAPGVGEVTP